MGDRSRLAKFPSPSLRRMSDKASTSTMDHIQLALGTKTEAEVLEQRGTLDQMEDACDGVCPEMDFTTRCAAFVICFIVGWIITLGSFFRLTQCMGGDCAPFGIYYTIGNIIAVASSFFLSGPCSQLKSMCDEDRWQTSTCFIFTMILTLTVALVTGIADGIRMFLIIVSCVR